MKVLKILVILYSIMMLPNGTQTRPASSVKRAVGIDDEKFSEEEGFEDTEEDGFVSLNEDAELVIDSSGISGCWSTGCRRTHAFLCPQTTLIAENKKCSMSDGRIGQEAQCCRQI